MGSAYLMEVVIMKHSNGEHENYIARFDGIYLYYSYHKLC